MPTRGLLSKSLLLAGLLAWLPAGRLLAQKPEEIAWLNQHSTPVQAVRAGSGLADLAPLGTLVAGAKVVGLGECTHGSHEVFQLKQRLLEYLVEQQGFTTFAFEAGYGWGETLNEYIQTGKGDSATVHRAMDYENWNTTEFWDMIEWMRAYNQQHTAKIRYVGIDMQNPYPSLARLDHYATQQADTVLSRRVKDLRNYYLAFRKVRGAIPAATKRHMVQLSDELARHLQATAAPVALQQHGQVLLQGAQLYQAGIGSPIRDKNMATNVAWALAQGPATKVVLWAHNEHVNKFAGSKAAMGHYLAQQLGPAYVALGFATGNGTASVGGNFLAVPLTPPVPNSAERWLDQVRAPIFCLNLRELGASTPATNWLLQRHSFRKMGVLLLTKQFYARPPLPSLYDALIYLHQTSASLSYRAAHPAK